MNTDNSFTRAVAALSKAVRTQLDGDAPLNWTALEDARTAAELGEAARVHGRLPDCVETLLSRLIGDVGIACADLVAGVERQESPGAWTQAVAIESEGETYRLLNRVNGDLYAGIRAEAVAGYSILALSWPRPSTRRWGAGSRLAAATRPRARMPRACWHSAPDE